MIVKYVLRKNAWLVAFSTFNININLFLRLLYAQSYYYFAR